jgi:CelD/BcsL family acetyltransferase involved in cellulose biosynthesis
VAKLDPQAVLVTVPSAATPLLDDRKVAAEDAAREGSVGADRAVRYRITEVGEMSTAERDRWLELRASNPALDSPYFHPGFTAAVAATSPNVRLIIGEDARGTITWFLPVQLNGRMCRPAGAPAADFQGPICSPGTNFDIAQAVAASGAASYVFDHMRDGVRGLEACIQDRQPSPHMNVEGGIDGYLSRCSRSGKDKVAEARRLTKKAGREYGPVQFIAESRDPALLDTLISLKRRQYADTGARDYFAAAEHVELMHRLLANGAEDFGGVLSAVFAGPHLFAAHFGLRAGPVVHWWFPVYNPQFSRFSPGWMLLYAVIEAAEQLGVERIDLGRGMDDYKRRAMTGQQLVCQGAFIGRPLRRHAAVARTKLLTALKSSPAGPPLRRAVRYARQRSG